MSVKVRIDDRLPEFAQLSKAVLADALQEGARDILEAAKTKAPFLKGGLRRQSGISVPDRLKRRISFDVEYARYQEFGGDSRRRVRKYTTPGTGAHYLESSGDDVAKRMPFILKKHSSRIA